MKYTQKFTHTWLSGQEVNVMAKRTSKSNFSMIQIATKHLYWTLIVTAPPDSRWLGLCYIQLDLLSVYLLLRNVE
jgi:hypothetical protein